MLKKLLLLLAVCLAVFSCSRDSVHSGERYADGTYSGVGDGRGGGIIVSVTIENHIITDIRIISQSESKFAIPCEEQIIAEVMQRQTMEGVDAVSGATLTSAGIMAAISSALNAARGIIDNGDEVYSDCSCDIVVVGAGGAGLSAAIEAAGKGKSVIVLEKQGIAGGNTNYSTGGLNAAGTAEQKELGIEDSPELHFEDTMKGGHNYNTPALVHTLTEAAADAVEWLKGLGADMSNVGKMAGSSVPRSHRPDGGAAVGPHIMKVLRQGSEASGVPIRLHSTVTGLLTDKNGAVTGVEVSSAKGDYRINSKAVVIATGGFGANAGLIGKFRPELKDFSTSNHPGATGDALSWIDEVKADTLQMKFIQTHPTGEKSSHILITEAIRGNGAILVNRSGKRFANEMLTRDALSNAILSQDGKSAFIVFGESVRQSLAVIENYIMQGLVKEGASIKELASASGLPSEAFEASIKAYNEYQEAGVDAEFGRAAEDMPVQIDAPYYCIEIEPVIHHTMGGIRIDDHARVLRKDGTAVPGLFAAGEVTGGIHGDNRLGGNAVADIIVFGRIAGSEAAKDAGSCNQVLGAADHPN